MAYGDINIAGEILAESDELEQAPANCSGSNESPEWPRFKNRPRAVQQNSKTSHADAEQYLLIELGRNTLITRVDDAILQTRASRASGLDVGIWFRGM